MTPMILSNMKCIIIVSLAPRLALIMIIAIREGSESLGEVSLVHFLVLSETMEQLVNTEDDKHYLIFEESIGMIVDAHQPEGVEIVHQKISV